MLTPEKMIAEYGAWYKEGNINSKDLHDQIFTKSDTEELFTFRKTNDTRIDKVNTIITSVLQPFYATFSHLGSFDFDPNPWFLDRVKINVALKPDDLAETAIDFLAQKGVERKGAPIVALIAKYLVMKAKEDNEVYGVFKGVRALPSAANQLLGVPGSPADSVTGIRAKIRAYSAASKTVDIAAGAVPTDPVEFVTYMENYYYAIEEDLRDTIKDFVMSRTLRTRYKRGFRLKYKDNYDAGGATDEIIDTEVKIKGYKSHNASDMIWTTMPENRIGYRKNPTNFGVFDLGVKDIYQIQMATDWYTGVDFINPSWIITNGQDLTD